MRTFKRFTCLFCLTLMFTMMFSVTVFATEETEYYETSTGDAIQDILVDGRFQGALDSISIITEFVDIWFIRIISVVSFFIISAALLKNVCAGAYYANSKFWDKVADAHQKNDAISMSTVKQYFGGGQFQNTSIGGLKDFLLGIVPNIKAFTDFDDADIEPKAYFMKAIPQMIGCVIIGVFIYNGYYRDTAAKVGEMGSVLVSRTLNSVNPESLVNSFFNATSWPDYPWEGDSSEEGKGYLKIAKELQSLVASNFNDVTTSESKSEVVRNIVDAISKDGSSIAWAEDGEEHIYKLSNIKSYASSASGLEGYSAGAPVIVGGGTPGESDLNYRWVFDLHSIVPSVDKNSSNQYAYVTFTLKMEVCDSDATSRSGTNASVVTDAVIDSLADIAPATLNGTDFAKSNKTQGGKVTEMTLKSNTLNFAAFGISETSGVKFVSTVGDIAYNSGDGAIIIKDGGILKSSSITQLDDGSYQVDLGYFTVSGSNKKYGRALVNLGNLNP